MPPSPPPPVYTLMNEARSWSDANAACLAAGLQLASVQSAAENALLVTAAAGNQVWIGGIDAASDGTWKWSPSGTPLSYTNWEGGEPNGVFNDFVDCVEVYANGRWNDHSCTVQRRYVCETPRCTGHSTFAGNAWDHLRTAVVEYNSNAAAAIAKYGPIACWDVSGVTDMSHLFSNLRNFNADISGWDTSGVTDTNEPHVLRGLLPAPCPPACVVAPSPPPHAVLTCTAVAAPPSASRGPQLALHRVPCLQPSAESGGLQPAAELGHFPRHKHE